VLGAPFIGPRRERGGRTRKRIGRPVMAASMPVIRFGGEGKRRGEWGVKRGSATPFPGEEGTPSVSRGGRMSGEAHTTVRGEGGGGWAGRRPRPGGWAWGEGGGPREEEGSGPVADHMGWAEKGKEAGPKTFLGLKSKSIRKSILIDFLD
jgi:hypothetical protein